FSSYSQARVTDLLLPEQLAKAQKLMINESRSITLVNEGGRRFTAIPLPSAVQITRVYGVEVADFNQDGLADLIVGGNQYRAKPEMGTQGAGYGQVLLGTGTGHFKPILPGISGVHVPGEIRDIKKLGSDGRQHILIMRNNERISIYEYGKK
ncbi:MAG: FG-GAP and VCBS repeat-containing protein, partial [Cyclobacteriaceae bacterium]